MDIPETQTLAEKLAHKKFAIALLFVWKALSGEITLQRLIVAAIVAIAAIICQTYLDRKETQ
ncbi:MAG: hypothetical protein AMJ65_08175 [Phycisphaerae bacterium SG8_4]|nr:MAG: hypothetical protein AMJ65_08175 [Phycisphaerae bacterium SG8_4]